MMDKRHQILLLLLLVSFFFGWTRPLSAKIIQAKIEHREVLPEVPSTFQKGSVVNFNNLKSRVEWFPIPDWMAGRFTKEGDIETFEEDFQSGRTDYRQVWLENKVSLSFGHQSDFLNTIWHAEVLPFRADGKRGRDRDQRYVVEMNCLKSSKETVVLRFHTIVVTLDRKGRVRQSRQQEEIVKFYPQDSRFIASTSSTKTFSSKGKPLYRLDSHTKRLKTARYKPVSHMGGIDLKKSLNDFLVSNNMNNRVVNSY